MKRLSLLVLLATASGAQAQDTPDPSVTVVPYADVEWSPLNPVRGDASPRAGTLWGDRTGTGASGFLVQFAEGFSSPPHIHNVTYRGVVIRGLVHNDDPGAAPMWMPPGSYWTQPAGEAHVTSAEGTVNLAYIEIQEGPYLVRPTKQAFDNGERPLNVDASNLVWLGAASVSWIDPAPVSSAAEAAVLWGDPRDGAPSGLLVRLPASSGTTLHGLGATLRTVVLAGRVSAEPPAAGGVDLPPGSYVGSTGPAAHVFTCGPEDACLLYVRAEGGLQIVPGPSAR